MNTRIFAFKPIARAVTHIGFIIFIFVVQTAVLPLLPFFSSSPNLILILTFSYGLLYGEFTGMIVGLFVGAMLDFFYTGNFGYYALFYIVMGYLNGMLSKTFYEDNIIVPMVLAIINSLAYNLLVFLIFLIRGRTDFMYYLFNIIVPNVIFTLIVTVIFYKVLYMFKKRK